MQRTNMLLSWEDWEARSVDSPNHRKRFVRLERMDRREEDLERIRNMLCSDLSVDENGCWNRDRRMKRTGYTTLSYKGGVSYSHRYSYYAFIGAIDGEFGCMTDDELRRALAERLGETDRWVLRKYDLYYRPGAHGYTGSISEAWILTESEADKHTYPHDQPVTKHPAPLPSLSELVATGEGRLDNGQQNSYGACIARELIGAEPGQQLHLWARKSFQLITAPAAVRARALLEVLK